MPAGVRPISRRTATRPLASLRRRGYAKAFSLTTRSSHGAAEACLGETSVPTLVVMGEQDPDFEDPEAEAALDRRQGRGRVHHGPRRRPLPAVPTARGDDAGNPRPGRQGGRGVPRAGLNETLVIEAAEVFVDECGLGQMTMAGLAGRLGVRQPSLYKHVANIEALKARRRPAGKARSRRGSRPCCDWALWCRGDLVGVARRIARSPTSTRGAMRRHSVRLARADADDAAASRAVTQVVFNVLASYELRDDDAVDATRALALGLARLCQPRSPRAASACP